MNKRLLLTKLVERDSRTTAVINASVDFLKDSIHGEVIGTILTNQKYIIAALKLLLVKK